MAGFIFNTGSDGLTSGGSINWASDTIRVRPVLTTQTLDPDSTVMTGLGVTGYDVTVTSKTKTKVDATNRVAFSFASFAFPAVLAGVGQVNQFIVFKFVTNDAASVPISVVDMTPTTPNGADINVTINALGAFYLQQ